jgi:hypothetical protein
VISKDSPPLETLTTKTPLAILAPIAIAFQVCPSKFAETTGLLNSIVSDHAKNKTTMLN